MAFGHVGIALAVLCDVNDVAPSKRTFLRWRVGTARITRILDVEVSGLGFLLPDATVERLRELEWLHPYLVDSGEAAAAIQSFVIEIEGRTILVDSAAGEAARAHIPARIERAEPYLAHLVAAGFPPETIDLVIHTHLHFDHVGYNLRPSGEGESEDEVPTFPNARHLIVSTEWSFWRGAGADADRAPVERAVLPLMAAHMVDLVQPGQQVAPGISLEPTPGHTPGHVSVRVRSGNQHAMVSGDVIHHPVQLARPSWTCTWDHRPDAARATRGRFLEGCAASGELVLGTHFPRRPAGFVVRDGSAFRFEAADPAG